jgi:meso-butanediol dehydrogenase/(S,S)-butanediol dehydrogenase/diacetyl reductase
LSAKEATACVGRAHGRGSDRIGSDRIGSDRIGLVPGGLAPQLTRSLAVEYLKSPLRVNAIAPAGTNTNLASGVQFPEGIDADLAMRMSGHRGMTEPAEIAGMFAFLASDEARSVTGAVCTIDNGLTVS